MSKPYSSLPNRTVRAANGIGYTYRYTEGQEDSTPLVLLQHFRGNLDYWDPALVDALAQSRRVIAFDNAGVATPRAPRRTPWTRWPETRLPSSPLSGSAG
jgi:pimeloyl-ACP methyl ester carboxylesterase